ncbi:MAG TPA: hypothetical protein EYN66_03415 [Myxococcales bacterium]|nr:hypothetical protein [Myxococcales bacterium]
MNGIKIALCLLILASWVSPVEAAQVIHFQLPQLVHHSNFIVHGQIQDIRTMRSNDAPGRIQRVVSVATKEVLKSDTQHSQAKTLSFVMAGGRMGRFRQFVPGLPAIQVGDKVVLFLHRRTLDGALILTGMAQGHYSLTLQPSGFMTARSDRQGIHLISRAADGHLSPAPASARVDEHPLHSFLASIRKEVGISQ